MEEPSVYDYIKALLTPWKGNIPTIPSEPADRPTEQPEGISLQINKNENQNPITPKKHLPSSFYWRILLLVALVLSGQWMIEPPNRNILAATTLYATAVILSVWLILRKELVIQSVREVNPNIGQLKIHFYHFLVSLPLLLIAFLMFWNNKFNFINLSVWVVAIILIIRSQWIPDRDNLTVRIKRFLLFIKNPKINIHIGIWELLLLCTTIFVIFFRFYLLNSVPGEMFSDHAEKLLDVSDVLSGKTLIFFPRNTGREALQIYLTAFIAFVFRTGLSFISLKIGTALAGFFALPFIYLLGKEIANRWVGFSAFLFAGIAYWPNVISRVGLRFPLYPLFVAPVLYYLIRGIRSSNINYYILSGLALGLGLHGYSPFRLVPLVIVAIVGIYLLHQQSTARRCQALRGLIILAFISLVVFLPLLRYMLSNPEMFNYRALSRLGTAERTLPGPIWSIFFNNLWKALIMFFWDNGNIWVHSIPGRPALDVVSAGFFFIGLIILIARYFKQRNWIDISILLLVPLLMMPSVLSLAFPGENPSLNRTGGAIIPVFIIIAIGFETIIRSLYLHSTTYFGKSWVIAMAIILIGLSSAQNYDLVFHKYNAQFLAGAWNTSTMGNFIRAFADSIGKPDSAYVVPYPYWVDTRLVGINAGYPTKDYALWPDNFRDTLSQNEAKLFLLYPEDIPSLMLLQNIYPQATYWIYNDSIRNGVPLNGKDFIVFFVPPNYP